MARLRTRQRGARHLVSTAGVPAPAGRSLALGSPDFGWSSRVRRGRGQASPVTAVPLPQHKLCILARNGRPGQAAPGLLPLRKMLTGDAVNSQRRLSTSC
jgi:hypothetical protein